LAQPLSTGYPHTVTVVIPHRGGDTGLWACIRALRAQTYPTGLFNVVIALNEPTRRNLDFDLRESESLVWEPRGFSYNARNTGIKSSTSDVVALTDSDTVPDPEWLTEGVAALSAGADIVAGHITVTTTTMKASLPALYELLFAFDQQKNVAGGFSTTANLFARRHVFTQQGLFDETALTGEDFEWTRSAVENGVTLTYSPHASVEHPARETWSALFAKARRTTLPYVGVADSGSSPGNHLRERFRFQLIAPPSPSRVSALSKPQRSIARFVRLVLVAYKALCLLRVVPAFKKDLRATGEKQLTLEPAIQGANP